MAKRRKRRARGEGAVFWSESKQCWVARAVVGAKANGSPRYRECRARTQAEALAKKRSAEEQAKAGYGITDRYTVAEYCNHWLENVIRPKRAAGTTVSYSRCIRVHIAKRIGGVKLAALRPPHVEGMFAAMLSEGCSKGNAEKVFEVLTAALNHATKTGVIPKNPAAVVDRPKSDAREVTPFTPEEVRAIRQAAAGCRLESAVLMALGTGMRQGEILGVAWPDIDLEASTLSVQTSLCMADGFRLKGPKSKNGRRVIDLPRFVFDSLQRHRQAMLREGNIGSQTVFCTGGGNFINRSWFNRRVWIPLLKKAGVPYKKFHTCRHTVASELLSAGISVTEVARRLGDSVLVVLRTYGHYLPRAGRAVAEKLEELYG
jgi:integrase